MGPWDGLGCVPGIVPLPAPQSYHHPGYTPPHHMLTPGLITVPHVHVPEVNSAVGLKSVDQVSLSLHFSGFQGFTEVYNLVEIHKITNHSVIPGNE